MAIHALTFVFGVWLLQQLAYLPSVWVMMCLSIFAVLAIFFFRQFRAVLILSVLALGFCWAGFFAQLRLSETLPEDWEQRDIEVQGVVASLPQQFENGTRFVFDVERVMTAGAIVPRHISLAQYSSAEYSSTQYSSGLNQAKNNLLPMRAGERWRLLVKLKRPHGLVNPNGFDFEAWALERNIRATGSVRKSTLNHRIDGLVWSPRYVVQRIRQLLKDDMQAVLINKTYAGVLQALVIGSEDAISPDDWQIFLRTGTNHLMSISGLHITMLSGLVFSMVMFGWRRLPWLTLRLPARKAAVLAGMLTAFCYALIAGFSVPTQRTFYMLGVFALALWSGRKVNIACVLAYALFVVVLLDPWAVLAPGFWLSFGAVAFMAFALGGRLGQLSWWLSAVRSQWVVTLALVPFLLVFFQQFSTISPLANAFAIPMVSLLVVPLAILGALFSLDSALLWAHSLMTITMRALEYFANFSLDGSSWAVWQQSAPPPWAALLAVLGMVWLFLPKGFPLRFLGVMFVAPMFLIKPTAPSHSEMRLTVLDVGQGLAALIQTQNHSLLYDTGSKTSSQNDSGLRVLNPYLRSVGIKHLDGLVVSHNDTDHSGGMASVLDEVSTDWLLSSLPEPVEAVRNLQCFAGQTWVWDGVKFEVLSPEQWSYQLQVKDNNRSCVIKVTSKSGSVLLAGDIEREVENELVSSNIALKSDVLIVPHHGSKTSSSNQFIESVQPKIAIFTAGYRNRFGHPKSEVVERYISRGIQAYRSDGDGAVLIDFDRHHISQVTAWRHKARRYWYD